MTNEACFGVYLIKDENDRIFKRLKDLKIFVSIDQFNEKPWLLFMKSLTKAGLFGSVEYNFESSKALIEKCRQKLDESQYNKLIFIHTNQNARSERLQLFNDV